MYNKLAEECRTAVSNAQTYKKDLNTANSNMEYAKSHINQQNTLINECRTVIIKLREQAAASETNKINSEHLAKKSIQLVEENEKLKNYIVELESNNYSLTKLCDIGDI
jgi:hypothetical protein